MGTLLRVPVALRGHAIFSGDSRQGYGGIHSGARIIFLKHLCALVCSVVVLFSGLISFLGRSALC